jgi:Uma2 family endonuclease
MGDDGSSSFKNKVIMLENDKKLFSYSDYLRWDSDKRVALINGIVYELESPNRFHQDISGRLFLSFGNFFQNSPCKLYAAPFDVRLPHRKDKTKDEEVITVVQPDLCIICDPKKLDEKGCIGTPDLVIEIISPGNSKKEMKQKFNVYQESGVKEYWMVLSSEKSVIVYTLNDTGIYNGNKPYTEDDCIQSIQFPGLSIDLSAIFAE